MGAISTASVGGIPLVAAGGAVAGGWGGWALGAMVSKRSMLAKIAGLVVGAYAGSRVLPAATDAVGL